MKHKPGQSPLWEHINKTQITKETINDLTNFKSGGVNFKIALWDPQVNGVRYLKTLIYNLCANLSSENWNLLRRIRNRNVGNPITVTYNGESVCMDYLQAVFELKFISDNVDLEGLRIVEIGAGYGRTCHSVLSNYNVVSYHIIDLENSLNVARKYLATVLDDTQFAKLNFVSIDEVDKVFQSTNFDLCINVDSFAEMDEETVKYYLSCVDDYCHLFYVKNPVGKYLAKDFETHPQDQEVVNFALGTGLLRDIIDIHDNQVVAVQSKKFLSAYTPSNNWSCMANDWSMPWSYYWQAFYRKKYTETEKDNAG